MKRYAKRLKEYENSFEFDTEAIVAGMKRLKGVKTVATRIELEGVLFRELKEIAAERGISYQVLMRILIESGFKRLKESKSSK